MADERDGGLDGNEERSTQVATDEPRRPFPVVGIGASAGGLEALSQFFGAMPGDSGMSFVVVQHLDPKRQSHLASLLDHVSSMPVAEIEEGTRVEPNRVYVIRPNRELTIHRRVLHLAPPSERRGARHPIDMFFRSLAEDQEEGAIAIVLSGTGSNGSAGIRAIREAGGLTFAQDPETAGHDGMPRNSIATGMIDFVLAPERMPEALLRHVRHLEQMPTTLEELSDDSESGMSRLMAFLRDRSGHDFRCYKKSTLSRRVHRRMSLTSNRSLADYESFLRRHAGEVDALVKDMMISVTGFFRDPEAWAALDQKVIAPLVRERQSGDAIRIWVPACATGEEAYTIAVLLAARAEQAQKTFEVKIFATDTADHHLSFARHGAFPAAIEKDVAPARLARFFGARGDLYQVKPELREWVIFAPHDLLRDPPFFRLDLISCRNLLIYLEEDAQAGVLALCHFALNEGGHMFLGSAETVGRHAGLFDTVSKKWRIYRRLGPTRHDLVDFPTVNARREDQQRLGSTSPDRRTAPRLPVIAQRALADRYAPASVLIDRAYHILYFHGRTERYLSQPEGEPTRDLVAMAREGLGTRLRRTLQQAISKNERTSFSALFNSGGAKQQIAVAVEPLRGPLADGLILVTFEDMAELAAPGPATPSLPVDEGTREREFEAELRRAREELSSTVEQLETVNEELQASNEEMTSMNEELRSSNEELETSKEELQSLNEELNTVNNQLQCKVEELEDTTNDLSNLLASTDIATIFLDRQFCIRRFTPAMTKMVDIIQSDVGRPFSHFAARFTDACLMDDARRTLDTLVPIEAEVRDHAGRWHLRRILPYRTQDDRIDGVVVTFTDVTTAKDAENALRAAHEHMQSIYDTVREPLLVLSPDLRVRSANESFYRRFQTRPDQTEGRLIYELGSGEWDIPRLRELLDDILPADHAFEDFEVEPNLNALGRRTMLLNARRLDHVQLILLAIEDVTERRHWEERQALLMAELNHRVKNMLATVQAIASQTIRTTPSLEGFQETFNGRIQALGSAHKLLSDSNWHGTRLGALIEEILRPYDGRAADRLTVECEDLALTAHSALALSLVINELATNASKYGALSREEGRVQVDCRVAGEAGRKHVRILWRESGGPPAEAPVEKGFGLSLIERSIAYELDGDVVVTFLPEGLRCDLHIPHNNENFQASDGSG